MTFSDVPPAYGCSVAAFGGNMPLPQTARGGLAIPVNRSSSPLVVFHTRKRVPKAEHILTNKKEEKDTYIPP